MSATAVESAPTEDAALVSTPDPSLLFMARRSDLRLVKKSIRPVRNAEGIEVDKTLGETLEFKEGVLRVPTGKGEQVALANGLRVKAAEVVEWLRKHRLLGDWQEGFWEVDPVAPPASEAEMATLQDLAIDLNASGLRDFIEQEQAGWARKQILAVAAGTLERVEAKLQEVTGEREKAIQDALAAEQAKKGPSGAA